MFSKLLPHWGRVQRHIGRKVVFGSEHFRMHGYYANRLNTSDRHETNLTRVFARELAERRGAFVDVGVNVGQTMCKVLGADRSRRYIGFEPQIGCCFFVDQFLRLNSVKNATILPIALSDTNGIFTLWSSNAFDEMASIADRDSGTGIAKTHATHVTARIGDEVLHELGVEDICAIKIDVEGAERSVLNGLRETLRSRQPTIFFEVLPNFYGSERIFVERALAQKNNVEAKAIFDFFSRENYSISVIDEAFEERPIVQFSLDDTVGYVSFNFVARPCR